MMQEVNYFKSLAEVKECCNDCFSFASVIVCLHNSLFIIEKNQVGHERS